jgi:hypothetical protein
MEGVSQFLIAAADIGKRQSLARAAVKGCNQLSA